jgi:L-serine dehydratase
MCAACAFVTDLDKQKQLAKVHSIKVDLYGSLALTGKGHGTDKAILMGLEGESPEIIDPDTITFRVQNIIKKEQLLLRNKYKIYFNEIEHLIWHKEESLPLHSNGMRFSAYDKNGHILCMRVYYSIGGGFIVREHEFKRKPKEHKVPYPFASAKELRHHCQANKLTIKDIMLANEKTWRSETEIRELLLNIASIMEAAINKGCATTGILPGKLKLERRACTLHKRIVFFLQCEAIAKRRLFVFARQNFN